MNWGDIIVETIIASLITGIFGVIVVLITNIFVNKRGYDKIDSKIGNVWDSTLSSQHGDIKENINRAERSINERLSEKTSSIYYKVDSIDNLLNKNEGRYENLNLTQREIKDNVNKLLFGWQNLTIENNKLREENFGLRDKIHSLEDKLDRYRDDEWDMER